MNMEYLKFSYTAGEKCKVVLALRKTVWQLKKLYINLHTYDPAVPLLDIYPKGMKTCAYTHMLIAGLFVMVPKWKQPRVPSTGE